MGIDAECTYATNSQKPANSRNDRVSEWLSWLVARKKGKNHESSVMIIIQFTDRYIGLYAASISYNIDPSATLAAVTPICLAGRRPATSLPWWRSITGRHETRVNMWLLSTKANLPLTLSPSVATVNGTPFFCCQLPPVGTSAIAACLPVVRRSGAGEDIEMTASLKILVASLTLVATGTAYADCAADLAKFEAGASASADGIAKDGSLAPLQGDTATGGTATDSMATGGSTPGTADAANGNKIAKDGSTAPLESTSGASSDLAMSGQDAQAQQEGRATAAEQAQAETGTDARATALRDARAALEAGDEAACQEALKRAAAS